MQGKQNAETQKGVCVGLGAENNISSVKLKNCNVCVDACVCVFAQNLSVHTQSNNSSEQHLLLSQYFTLLVTSEQEETMIVDVD